MLVAALTGASAVGLGAFGAHGLESMLEETGRAGTWETAVLYHLVHSVVLLLRAQQREGEGAGMSGKGQACFWLFFGGILVFSGTLYLLCLTGQTWLGAVTPIGGVALMAGWVSIGFRRAEDRG